MANSIDVNIKMYRLGEVGDCFLLRFSDGVQKTHVLIDCGTYSNSKKSIERLVNIATDIKDQLNGAPLDVVVCTHPHNDHISGFYHAQKIFREIGIEKVWLPWLENPVDEAAAAFQAQQQHLIELVARFQPVLQSVKSYDKDNSNHKNMLGKINDILQFYGIDPSPSSVNGIPSNVLVGGMAFLRSAGKKGAPDYLYPGDVLDLPGLPAGAVKVYVLGPPKVLESAKSTASNQRLAMAIDQSEYFLSSLAIGMNTKTGIIDKEEDFPFRENEKIYVDQQYFKPEYSKNGLEILKMITGTGAYQSYQDLNQQWRTIDHDWIEQADDIALYLNELTNNSSLVLAFEVVASEKVLLFVGDAQMASWRSWFGIQWPEGIPKNKTEHLLANTVVYKVGHHGSHNATHKPVFEKMRHPELVAIIPVDQGDTNIIQKTNPWQMPAKNLYEEIKKQCACKVLRMDDGVAKECEGGNPVWESGIIKTDLYISVDC